MRTAMEIIYSDGTTREAVLLCRKRNTLRVAVSGEDDARILRSFAGTWFTEECEPVQVVFEWERYVAAGPPAEADCICSEEFALRSMSVLVDASNGDDLLEDMLLALPAGQHGQAPRKWPKLSRTSCGRPN